MSVKKYKILLLQKDLSVPIMARKLANDKRPYSSTRVMIWQMFGGFNYYPKLAGELKTEFGITIPRPKTKRHQRALQKAA